MRYGVDRSQHVETLSAGGHPDEPTDPRSEESKERRRHEMRRIHEVHNSLILPRMRMVESLVAEFVYRFFRELDLDHWALLARPRKTMPRAMRPVRQFTPRTPHHQKSRSISHPRGGVLPSRGIVIFTSQREIFGFFQDCPTLATTCDTMTCIYPPPRVPIRGFRSLAIDTRMADK